MCLNMAYLSYKKSFDELTNQELYQLLDLRLKVFVTEQKIVYTDTDFKDQKSLHYFIMHDDHMVSYLRVIPKGLKYEEFAIGRVATDEAYRHQGLATKLIKQAMEDLKGEPIRISAQAYLKAYYEGLGFKVVKGPYIEEDILHYEMLCNNG